MEEIKASPLFALQINESTDVSLCSKLLDFLFCRYLFKDDVLFWQSFEMTTKANDVMDAVSSFLGSNELSWINLLGITNDWTPPMLGSRSCFQTMAKSRAPNAVGIYSVIHREALASKSLPSGLNVFFKNIAKVVQTTLWRLLRWILDFSNSFIMLWIQSTTTWSFFSFSQMFICWQILRSVLHPSEGSQDVSLSTRKTWIN